MNNRPIFSKRLVFRRALVALLALAMALGGWWGRQQYQLEQHWQSAQQALERQDCWRARAELRLCLSAWPDRLEVRLSAARAARLADALDEAEGHIAWCERQSAMRSADSEDVRFERVLLQLQQGDVRSYERETSRYLQSSPIQKVLTLDALARGFAETYHVGEAVQCLKDIDAIDPGYLPAFLLRAQLRTRFKNHEEAVGPLDKAVAFLPEALEPRLQLAECLLALGRPRDAAVHLERLRGSQPEHAGVLLALARCRIYRNQLDEARQLLDRLLTGQPRHVEALIERGRLEFRVGDLDAAAALLQRALDVQSDHIVAWRLLTATSQAQGSSADFERCQAKVEQLDRDLGRLQRRELRLTQAAKPGAAELYELGECWRGLHNEREAQKWYASALQQDPHHRPTHRALSTLFDEAGKGNLAARHRQLAERESD